MLREADSIDQVSQRQMQTNDGSQVNIMCDSISMPAHDLQSEEHVTYGPPSQIVTGHGFTGTIGASFYADKYLRERHFFESWQKMAVNMKTHRVGYLKDYAGKIQIFQLGSHDEGGGDRDVPTYGIEAIECYPETVSAIEYNYGSSNQIVRVTVGFQYKQWHNLATDKIAGMTFGTSTQTQHDINPACNNEEDIALVNEFFTSYDAPWPNYLGHDLNYGSYCEGICSPAWSENTYHNQNEHSFISNDPNPPNVFADSVPPSSAFWWLIDWFRSACHCCPEGSIPTLGNHPNHMTGVMVGQNERPGVPLTPIGPQSHGDALQEAKRILKKIIGKRK